MPYHLMECIVLPLVFESHVHGITNFCMYQVTNMVAYSWMYIVIEALNSETVM